MLRQHLQMLSLRTRGEGFTSITAALNAEIAASGLRRGVATLVCLHTSCSLTVNENADPRVLQDLGAYMGELVPSGDRRAYLHDDEGPDDMPAHIRSVLTCSELTIPVRRGRLALGTWQGAYLWEHRYRPHRRQLEVTIIGI